MTDMAKYSLTMYVAIGDLNLDVLDLQPRPADICLQPEIPEVIVKDKWV